MKKFQQFETSVNEDGSVNILKVPIFKMGKHKGTDFDDALVDEIIDNHQTLKSDDDYLPSVIIGHNDDSGEKEAEGFLDNLLKEEGIVYADIVKVPEETFSEALKKRKYPHRSVEYNPTKKVFSALALLGGTAPHHKLPIMEFANDDQHLRIDFAEVDLESAIVQDEKLRKIRDLWWKMMEFIDKVLYDNDKDEPTKEKEIKSLLDQGTGLLGEAAKNYREVNPMSTKFSEEDKQKFLEEQNAQFKEKFGISPEEAVTQNKKFKEDQEKAISAARAETIKSFAEKLKNPNGHRLVASLVDEMIVPFMESLPADAQPLKFKEDEKETELSQVDFFQNLVEKMVSFAAEGKLQVEFNEQTKHGKPEKVTLFDSLPNMSQDDLAIHKKAVSFQEADPNLSYFDAVVKATEKK